MGSIDQSKTITLHGRTYKVPAQQPVVIVCVDGFDPEYLQSGMESGKLPTMARWVQEGFHAPAKCAMPSVTNPNNLSIITGMPTIAHGISGNYYLDKETNEEVMVVDASTMKGETILEKMGREGVRVAAVTAKDKLRRIINHGLSPKRGAICFSSQFAGDCTLEQNGIENVEEWLGRKAPPQYSGELSIYVLDAGLKLLRENRADLFYLTLSDYVQHKHAPGSPEADDFFQKLDARFAEFETLGAVVAVTGDHGMSDKSTPEGKPNVFFVEDFLNERFPHAKARVMCPIADPFVKHHGALGGFVRVHLTGEKSAADIEEMMRLCQKVPQVEMVLTGHEAATKFEMPEEREGELVVIAKDNAVLGSRADLHDLSQLDGHRLRSHGGLSEQAIPVLRSTKLRSAAAVDGKNNWRNYDIFDIALNY